MGSKRQIKRKAVLKLVNPKAYPGYLTITKKRLLRLHEKLEIINYPNQEELLNKRSNWFQNVAMLTSPYFQITKLTISQLVKSLQNIISL